MAYDDSVLAPRAWTIVQSHQAATLADGMPDGPMLELHCGAGHIGQAAAYWARRPLVQVDDNPAACEWARRNAATNDVQAEVRCVRIEDLDEPDGTFALVLADPPYVPSAEIGRFLEDPAHAIDGGDDGLDGVRACLPVAARLTRPGGMVVLQVRGPEQADALGRALAGWELGLEAVGTVAVSTDRAVVLLSRS